ncbi:ABC transporter substrate-binding protein [Paucibacter soli]|uniref:ABC transporter substrate-binding protein n=1 Tax=Paucibacter soli TaxID=3133433 RepID=UPI0030ADDACB
MAATFARVLAVCVLSAAALGLRAEAAEAQRKLLRYAFLVGETGFDPAQISDLYSRYLTAHIFDGLYKYDHLARPYKIKPNVADGMPEVSADFRTWTVKLKQGIYFADDTAFKGRKRELVAEDFVYSFKRFFDPATKSPLYSSLKDEGILGLDELRQQALKSKKPFDYDRPVEGLRALDRYTLQIKLAEARPRLLYTLAIGDVMVAVAREVIEAYPGKAMEHPVGTGPFVLKQWRRSSRMLFERNPNFREQYYDAEPNADDAEGQAMLARFKGRRLPMLDAVEIAIIEEGQPRWLSFLRGEFDLLFLLPEEYADIAIPHGRIAPHLAKQGIRAHSMASPDRTLFYFNMEDPVVGGTTPAKVALRRAIGLATDVGREIRQVRRGQAVPAQSVVAPLTWGYDADFKSENSDFDPARAMALLDIYGYLDRDGDGWREQPDGTPLLIEYASSPDSRSRPFEELWQKDMARIGIRIKVKSAQWPEQLKASRAGQLMVWQLGYSASTPDAQLGFELLYGPAAGGQNLGRFRNAQFDAAYDAMRRLPDGPERLAQLRELQRITLAYMPQKYRVHRVVTDLSQPWLLGFRRPVFGNSFWSYLDVDSERRAAP